MRERERGNFFLSNTLAAYALEHIYTNPPISYAEIWHNTNCYIKANENTPLSITLHVAIKTQKSGPSYYFRTSSTTIYIHYYPNYDKITENISFAKKTQLQWDILFWKFQEKKFKMVNKFIC